MKPLTTLAILSFAGFCAIGLSSCAKIFVGNAEKNLQKYAQRAGYTPIGCTNIDSDQDGYLSCDAKHPDGQTVALDCAYKPFDSGCKEIERTKFRRAR
ncbi:MAG TPA: hypothetical protein IGS17_08410 [Oscillatoriales cyanobacterium M59_W2019_021]|nr:MAG: hypothetical protein D6728_14330 [Cyanobacteria bacterium J055]HIK31541.1 hypothetical protein [Oscillatoriales cyanobacterium M4454_W2019_049]HIK50930.1 hypothetical protein [Oscillatoriales cyanobacterium M59_W2019_021]